MTLFRKKILRLVLTLFAVIAVSFAVLHFAGNPPPYDLCDAGLGLPRSVIQTSVVTHAKTGACLVRFTLEKEDLFTWLSSSSSYYAVTGRDKMSSEEIRRLYSQALSDPTRGELLLIEGRVGGADGRLVDIQVWVRSAKNGEKVSVRVLLDPLQ